MNQVEKRSLQSRIVSWTSGLKPVTVGATWVLFLCALSSLEGRGPGLETLVGGGLIGLPLVVVGFLSASRCRSVPERGSTQRARLVAGALLAGIGTGAVNLGANLGLAEADASVRVLLHERFADSMTWTTVVSGAVVEEVAFRLFLMSVIAWVAAQFQNEAHAVFITALVVSASAFAVLHLLGRPLPLRGAAAGLEGELILVGN